MRKCIIYLLSIFCIISCKQKTQKASNQSIDEFTMPSRRGVLGKYVYMSSNSILHSTLQCPQLQREKDDNGHVVVGVEFVDTDEIYPNYQFFYCKYCFNDIKYEQMKRILKRNSPDTTSLDASNLILE